MRTAAVALILSASGLPGAATSGSVPADAFDRHAESVGGWPAVARVETVRAVAEVTSPKGGGFRLELLWGRGGRFVFRQIRDEKPVFAAWIVPGLAVDGTGAPIDPATRSFVRAHDFLGAALDPLTLFRPAGPATAGAAPDGNKTISVPVRDVDGRPATLRFASESGRLSGFEMADPRRAGIRVVVRLDDYRPAGGVSLPRLVTVTDDAGPWVMAFREVTVGGVPESAFVPPAPSRETERQALLALHREVLDGHLASDARWLASEPEDYVVANRGEITRPSLEERRKRFGSYLGATRFVSYRDLVPTVVNVSRDGTLGWVICQVGAEGTQSSDGKEEPLSFVSAWIELYEKRDGAWRRVGNVSNFRP